MGSGKTSKLFIVYIFVVIFCLMAASFFAGVYLVEKNDIFRRAISEETMYLGELLGKYEGILPGKISQDVDFDLFWEAWDMVRANYVDKDELNDKKMFYGAIKGMVASLGDPYTVFMEPQTAKEFADDLAGTFEGIGAEIGIKQDILTIIAPLPDMPAEEAGLKAGDKVLAIDGETTMNISIDEAVNKIRGPGGTQVTLSIARDGLDEIKDIVITRGKIIVKSINTELRDDGIFVIEITNFNNDTEKLFNIAVREALENNPDGIILDLRNNPGGYLDTAIEIASEWVEDGIIVSEKYSEEYVIEHLARGRARLKDYTTIVLVNQGSASASEIVSGALQDNGLASIVGMQTFGKGSVQTLSSLEDGSSLKITVAKWITPKGRSISDEGIAPDYEINLTHDDYESGRDPQFEGAVRILKGESVADFLVGTSTDQK